MHKIFDVLNQNYYALLWTIKFLVTIPGRKKEVSWIRPCSFKIATSTHPLVGWTTIKLGHFSVDVSLGDLVDVRSISVRYAPFSFDTSIAASSSVYQLKYMFSEIQSMANPRGLGRAEAARDNEAVINKFVQKGFPKQALH